MTSPASPQRKKLLMLAYACDPDASMESRLGWNRAVEAAKHLDTWVITEGSQKQQAKLDERANEHPGLTIHCLPKTAIERRFWRTPGCLYSLYKNWHKRAFRIACKLHEQVGFDVSHQVNFCGYREPSYLYRWDVPFLWGPVGGTQNFPKQYYSELTLGARFCESVRSLFNYYDLNFNRRVRQAALKAKVVFAANTTGQRDFEAVFGFKPILQLETGLSEISQRQRTERCAGDTLNILWYGRLRPWKALPLLVKALAMLPQDVKFKVRVIGYGTCEAAWKRLVGHFGLAEHFEWIGWPKYADVGPHYQWADVFAFTSLRDTSGTGVLEALAYGVPIIGMGHQGAADIIDDSCGIQIPITNPQETHRAFAGALERIYRDPEYWRSLSRGAHERARFYLWESQAATFLQAYQAATDQHSMSDASHDNACPISASNLTCTYVPTNVSQPSS